MQESNAKTQKGRVSLNTAELYSPKKALNKMLKSEGFMDQVFTITQLKDKWETYQKAKCWRILRGGKWTVSMSRPNTTGGATRVEMVKVRDHLSFPKFLESMNA